MARAPDEDVVPEADRIDGHPHPRETIRLFGQDPAEASFLDAWSSGRMHHAWLIRGPAGIGKATLAYRIARFVIASADGGLGLLDDQSQSLDATDGCAVRSRIVAGAEPRLAVLRRQWDTQAKRFQTMIPVDSVRAVRRFLSLSAADGGWRVVLVDPADEMNRNAANALLKFLEEPPDRVLFLLISHAPALLLPTIRSRCRTLDLSPLGPEALEAALRQAGGDVAPGAREALAELSGGSAGRALRLLAHGGPSLYAEVISVMSGQNGVDRASMVRLAESCAGRGNDPRFRLLIDLTQAMLGRLARAAAVTAVPPEAAKGEAALIGAVATSPRQAVLWADAQSSVTSSLRHALAVNLDPAQTVIDTFLNLDTVLGQSRAAAL